MKILNLLHRCMEPKLGKYILEQLLKDKKIRGLII